MSGLLETLWAGFVALLPGGAELPVEFLGYVEGSYVFVAPETAGRIVKIEVVEGEIVGVGDVVFRLESRLEVASVTSAKARVAASDAALTNLLSGARPEELAVTQAALAQAQADLKFAERTLERSQELWARNNIPGAQVDADQSRVESSRARVGQLAAELTVQQLAARQPLIDGAQANLAAAKADLEKAEIALALRDVVAPASGRIEDIYYQVGEIATSNPVISILPDQGRKVRFFVPEAQRTIAVEGKEFPVTCSSCPSGLSARFSRIASTPEFTPPIIFSRDERARLVFLVEAVLPLDTNLQPGHPVSVGLPQ